MERFIIQFKADANNEPNTYWDGTINSTDLNDASLYLDLVNVRQAAGQLQSQFTDREVTIQKVLVTVSLVANATL